ncbi:MAG: hypothetical protein M1820_010093 [Bogoriella megaspora]|nr:MAG: hypothetical protein M1820_010093 [Bogoriella megaspora]
MLFTRPIHVLVTLFCLLIAINAILLEPRQTGQASLEPGATSSQFSPSGVSAPTSSSASSSSSGSSGGGQAGTTTSSSSSSCATCQVIGGGSGGSGDAGGGSSGGTGQSGAEARSESGLGALLAVGGAVGAAFLAM